MRRHYLCVCCISILFMAALSVSRTEAQKAKGPCRQVSVACQTAGFTVGGAKEGSGIIIDCVRPIMQAAAQRRKATKPLPQVDARVIAACKAANPNFGQPNVAQAPENSEHAPSDKPPAAVVAEQRPPHTRAAGAKRPNIVFILTDDLAWNLVPYMPHVLQMQKDGVIFTNYFVTNSLCCPSRSSIFTGRYPHNTGIFKNRGADGGYHAFRSRGHEATTFAVALSAAGYRTAMLGKYLNGYRPVDPVPPGWTSWAVAGGAGYREFNYRLNENGRPAAYGNKPEDYLTDVLSGVATRFIKQSTGTPFLIEIATFAPHAPYIPAPRDADALADLRAPKTPAFNAAPDATTPKWLASMSALSDADIAKIDADFRKRAQTVLAVDKMIGDLQAAVAAIGEDKNTYFVFSSDNGYHMGEHRLMPGKMTAYDTDIRVPLIVTGPGVPAGRTVEEITENIDLYPTFMELSGAAGATNVDGRSLVPLVHSQAVTDWRTLALIEHHGRQKEGAADDPDAPTRRSGNPPTYEAIRTQTALYVEYADGVKEYHDLTNDPQELHNTFASLGSREQAALHGAAEAAKRCQGAEKCRAAEQLSGERASATPQRQ
jgi:N-acetylglucosamine-6-sulfatase